MSLSLLGFAPFSPAQSPHALRARATLVWTTFDLK
jgi:hypothetical protein